MNAQEIFAKTKRLKISLWCEGDALKYEAPRGALTDELRAAIRAHKPELLALLQHGNAFADQTESEPQSAQLPSDLQAARCRFLLDALDAATPEAPAKIAAASKRLRPTLQRMNHSDRHELALALACLDCEIDPGVLLASHGIEENAAAAIAKARSEMRNFALDSEEANR
jgi:hypothetical protein